MSDVIRDRKLPALLAAALLALAGTATAQDSSQEEEPKWYTVEAVIFERLDPRGLETELWTADPGAPELTGVIELTDAAGQPLDVELAGASGDLPHAFQSLPPAERQLDGVIGRLERSETYRPLVHLAWRQPGFSEEQSKPVHVQVGPRLLHPPPRDEEPSTPTFPLPSAFAEETAQEEAAPTEYVPAIIQDRGSLSTALEGTLRLHLARYLHLKADLLYFTPPSAEDRPLPDEGAPMPSDEDAAGEAGAGEIWQPTLFRLQESRRMRSGELHYFDHPRFGVLALVTPFELPQPEEEPEAAQ